MGLSIVAALLILLAVVPRADSFTGDGGFFSMPAATSIATNEQFVTSLPAAQFLDVNNDGLPDVVLAVRDDRTLLRPNDHSHPPGFRVWLNTGCNWVVASPYFKRCSTLAPPHPRASLYFPFCCVSPDARSGSNSYSSVDAAVRWYHYSDAEFDGGSAECVSNGVGLQTERTPNERVATPPAKRHSNASPHSSSPSRFSGSVIRDVSLLVNGDVLIANTADEELANRHFTPPGPAGRTPESTRLLDRFTGAGAAIEAISRIDDLPGIADVLNIPFLASVVGPDG